MKSIDNKISYTIKKNKWFLLILIVVSSFAILPFLDLAPFSTKGEPREAVVAYTMMHDHNWILPQNNGHEFAYKPPMFHWAVALFSSAKGEVTELTARLPSAIAGIGIVILAFLFYARKRDSKTAIITGFVLLTCFDFHRSATTCRVDMLLTFFIVLSLMDLYRWTEKDLKTIPWYGIISMGLGMLTKGPVAIILPCLVTFFYAILKGFAWKKTFARLFLVGLSSFILPLLWYVAAFKQGGEKFLYLVYEENVLRFLGKMPYHSHENGWLYYFYMLPAGLLPYSLLCILSLFGIRKRERENMKANIIELAKKPLKKIRSIDSLDLFSIMSILVIFAFYCIPKSKRSVYVLPLYPFIAYYLATLLQFMAAERRALLRIYSSIVEGLAFVLLLSIVVVKWNCFDLANLIAEKFPGTIDVMQAFENGMMNWGNMLAIFVLTLSVVYFVFHIHDRYRVVTCTLFPLFGIFMMIDGFIMPHIAHKRTDKPIAEIVKSYAHKMPVYSYVDEPSHMLHFFTINFYADNKVQVFKQGAPAGLLLIGKKDFEHLSVSNPNYLFKLLEDFHHRSCDTHEDVQLYYFQLKSHGIAKKHSSQKELFSTHAMQRE